MPTRDERKNGRHGDEWSRDTRYGTSIGDFQRYGDSRFKKTKKFVKQVNEDYLKKVKSEKPVDVTICKGLPAEMDEMWSYYHDKSHQIWLWWAVDHATNTPLAFTFGTREHKNLDELLTLLEPFPISKVYTDNHFAYQRKIPAGQLITGKKNTQKIERDHRDRRKICVNDKNREYERDRLSQELE